MTKKMVTVKEKKETLNPRWAKFLDEYLRTGNAYQSAIVAGFSKNYAIIVTGHIPDIVRKSMKEFLSTDLLTEKHLALLNKKEKVTKNNIITGEIDVIDTGEIDVQAVKAGLDMAYKLRGDYAPVGVLNVNIDGNKLFSNEHKEKADRAIELFISGRNSKKSK